MRKLFLILMLIALMAFPSLAFAQSQLVLPVVNVQLWPEYDRPSMLVIVDYQVPTNSDLPVDVNFRIPKGANLIAVAAYNTDGALMNTDFSNPQTEGDWQVFTITLNSMQGHFEYYQEIAFNGDDRAFNYLWDSEYTVDSFNIKVMEPLDTTKLTSNPKLEQNQQEGDNKFYTTAPVALSSDESYSLELSYTKTSDALVASTTDSSAQSVDSFDNSASSAFSLNNSLPYIIGAIGLILIIGGVVYYLQAGKSEKRARPRKRASAEEGGDVYCSQCGTRGRSGDRFCRTCGSRLKQAEE